MVFKQIRLKNFRNFNDFSTTFSPRLNFFVGKNGQGKTNLLEALYLVSHGDSFRYGDNSVLIHNEALEGWIHAIAESKNLAFEIKLQIQKSKKIFTSNDKKVSSMELGRRFPSVLFSPESLVSIKEGADQRRDLIDDLLVTIDPMHSDLITEYRKALKTRNKVLRDMMDGITAKDLTMAVLESLEPTFMRLATLLSFARVTAIKSLLPEFNAAMQSIAKEQNTEVSVEYLISGANFLNSSVDEIANALHKRLLELRDAELATGSSLIGPQKHDVIFLYGQKDSRFYCSQGQQRAIILSFKMAQIVYHRRVHGFYPALMLDDVLSELDEVKREALINFLHEINTQIFITTTDLKLPDSFAMEKYSVMSIENGTLQA